jgi:hypothetical protein
MRVLALLLCAAGLLLSQEREGNFTIRFEPDAVLQTNAPIPFKITAQDSLGKPVLGATVTLQIETVDHRHVKVYKAPAIDQNATYMAKPVFPVSGEWNVYVEVHRNNAMSSRTIQYNVPETAIQ